MSRICVSRGLTPTPVATSLKCQDLLYLCLLFSPLECTFKFNSKTTGTDCILRQVLHVKRLVMLCDLNIKKDVMCRQTLKTIVMEVKVQDILLKE